MNWDFTICGSDPSPNQRVYLSDLAAGCKLPIDIVMNSYGLYYTAL